ncbi:MAG: signal transduction histidine kinase [Glaciecola sp.]|jgi:signal transduction histidine kinase
MFTPWTSSHGGTARASDNLGLSLMSDGLSIPMHLAVHLVGLAAVVGLLVYAISRRDTLGTAWPGVAIGGLLLGIQFAVGGLVLAENMAWPIYLRAAAYAAIAVGVAGSKMGSITPVAVAIAPISIHVTAGIAGLLAAVSSQRGLSRSGGLFASGLVAWAASDMLLRARPMLAALVSVLGSVLVLLWTVTAARTSMRARLLAAIAIFVSVAVVLVAASTGTLFSEQDRKEAVDGLQNLAAVLTVDVGRDWPAELTRGISFLAAQPTTIEVFSRAQKDFRGAEAIRRTGGADLVVMLDRQGAPIAGSWRAQQAPATWLPALAGQAEVQATLTSAEPQVGSTLLRGDGLGRTVIATYAAKIVRRSNAAGVDERLGTVVTARLVDVTDLQTRKRNNLGGVDFAVAAGNELILSTLGVDNDAKILDALQAGRDAIQVGGEEYLLGAATVPDIGVVPVVGVTLRQSSVLSTAEAETARSLFQRSVLALLFGLLGGVFASRSIARPLRQLTDVVDRVAAGDLSAPVSSKGRADELGRLADAFGEMTVSLAARQSALQRAAWTEAELRGQLQAVTDSMSDGLLATDRNGRVVACNPAAARLAGSDVADAIGRPLRKVLRGAAGMGARLEDLLVDVKVAGASERLRAKLEPSGLDVSITISALHGPVGSAPVNGLVIVLQDMTAEAELAKARRDFVTNISHELRTPLTLIMAPVRQLEKWRTNEAIAPVHAEILNRGTARMARLERELTEWAQVELGRYANVAGEANLTEVIKRSVGLVRWQYPDRDIRVKVPPHLPVISLSTEALSTILREIVHNAVLFSKHEANPVLVTLKEVDGGVEVIVTDRGIGMSDETMGQAFEPYWQLDASERRDFDGLGIGLTLANAVAVRAGTRVSLVSKLGQGTTATVLLPTQVAQ